MTLKSTPVYSPGCSGNKHQVGSQYDQAYLLPVFQPCVLSRKCSSALCTVTQTICCLFPFEDMSAIWL